MAGTNVDISTLLELLRQQEELFRATSQIVRQQQIEKDAELALQLQQEEHQQYLQQQPQQPGKRPAQEDEQPQPQPLAVQEMQVVVEPRPKRVEVDMTCGICWNEPSLLSFVYYCKNCSVIYCSGCWTSWRGGRIRADMDVSEINRCCLCQVPSGVHHTPIKCVDAKCGTHKMGTPLYNPPPTATVTKLTNTAVSNTAVATTNVATTNVTNNNTTIINNILNMDDPVIRPVHRGLHNLSIV